MFCVSELQSFIDSEIELIHCLKYIKSPLVNTYLECLGVLTEPNPHVDDCLLFKIDSILDYLHDELNTGHWSNVSITIRYAFTASTYIKALIILKMNQNGEEPLKNALKCLDLGLLLGAPLPNNLELLVKAASCINQKLNESPHENLLKIQKRKLSVPENELYLKINGEEIASVECPSIEEFNKDYFDPQIPVKLTACIDHWPAMQKWQNVSYLLKVAGDRTVPIEIGSHYADENWGQKLMLLKDFIKNHFLSETSEHLGYLAQHNLFDQIVELKQDICTPDYCCLSKDYDETTEPDVNAWFGPKNTVSPLHYDPKNNFLAQVFGTKQLILFSPKDSDFLYPHLDKLLNNTARINPLDPDLGLFPLFTQAKMYKCLLQPGEMVFIPTKWWHHVTALDKSFSVSFWWQ